MTTYDEWRVTGTLLGDGSARAWRWSLKNGDQDPEGGARRFATQLAWTDGPHLHKRTVTVTEWTEVDA